jgi:hypothetical protein
MIFLQMKGKKGSFKTDGINPMLLRGIGVI